MALNKVVYPGKDLEAMSFAVNYNRWLLEEFKPFIGKHIVEVGAGTGSFSKMLLESSPESLTLVEPSEMFYELVRNLSSGDGTTSINFLHSIFAAVWPELTAASQPDTIIYVNVLEHVEDDRRELEMIRETLAPGGRCLLFVPAVKALFSDFDREIGHFRRYTKRELEKKVSDAGFRILRSKNFDIAGVAPWFVKYRLMGFRSISPGSVSLYDNIVVPIFKRVESLVNVPIGKNVLIVAEK